MPSFKNKLQYRKGQLYKSRTNIKSWSCDIKEVNSNSMFKNACMNQKELMMRKQSSEAEFKINKTQRC